MLLPILFLKYLSGVLWEEKFSGWTAHFRRKRKDKLLNCLWNIRLPELSLNFSSSKPNLFGAKYFLLDSFEICTQSQLVCQWTQVGKRFHRISHMRSFINTNVFKTWEVLLLYSRCLVTAGYVSLRKVPCHTNWNAHPSLTCQADEQLKSPFSLFSTVWQKVVLEKKRVVGGGTSLTNIKSGH